MRHLFVASVLFATLAGGVYGHGRDSSTPLRRRKTLSFGPENPHAVFKSNPYQIQTTGLSPLSSATDPYDVARLFVSDVLSVSNDSWKIRKDSYTDESTGITHIYVRQVVSGLEVVDGDMNLNIKDGRVLSYGNSVSVAHDFPEGFMLTRWNCSFIQAPLLRPSPVQQPQSTFVVLGMNSVGDSMKCLLCGKLLMTRSSWAIQLSL